MFSEVKEFIENSVYDMMPKNEKYHIRELKRSGVVARITDISSPLVNLLKFEKTTTNEELCNSLSEVAAYFKNEGKQFGCVIHEDDSFKIKAVHELGLKKVGRFLGMFKNYSDKEYFHRSKGLGILVKEVQLHQKTLFCEVFSQAYGMTREEVQTLSNGGYFDHPLMRVRNYFAYLPDVDHPIGVASVFYYPNSSPYALLGGAAVLKEFRKNGAYQALIQRRVADALKEGHTTFFSLAHSETSAPVLKCMGFEEVSRYGLFFK